VHAGGSLLMVLQQVNLQRRAVQSKRRAQEVIPERGSHSQREVTKYGTSAGRAPLTDFAQAHVGDCRAPPSAMAALFAYWCVALLLTTALTFLACGWIGKRRLMRGEASQHPGPGPAQQSAQHPAPARASSPHLGQSIESLLVHCSSSVSDRPWPQCHRTRSEPSLAIALPSCARSLHITRQQ
jgi:hypothetical protein